MGSQITAPLMMRKVYPITVCCILVPDLEAQIKIQAIQVQLEPTAKLACPEISLNAEPVKLSPGQAQFATRSLLIWTNVNKVELSSVYVVGNLDDLPKCAATTFVDWFVWIALRSETSMHVVPMNSDLA